MALVPVKNGRVGVTADGRAAIDCGDDDAGVCCILDECVDGVTRGQCVEAGGTWEPGPPECDAASCAVKCSQCGTGERTTPKRITLVISGLPTTKTAFFNGVPQYTDELMPDPNGGTVLTQKAEAPCEYERTLPDAENCVNQAAVPQIALGLIYLEFEGGFGNATRDVNICRTFHPSGAKTWTQTSVGYFGAANPFATLKGTVHTVQGDDELRLDMGDDHGLVVGDIVDVIWDGGRRDDMEVIAVEGHIVTLTGGTGDPLPSEGLEVTVEVPKRPRKCTELTFPQRSFNLNYGGSNTSYTANLAIGP